MLAQFAATARDEVDLDRLTAEVLRVVEETMQPAHVSLLLRGPDGVLRQQTGLEHGGRETLRQAQDGA